MGSPADAQIAISAKSGPKASLAGLFDILAKVLSSQELQKKSSLQKRWGAMQHIFLHRISMRVLLA